MRVRHVVPLLWLSVALSAQGVVNSSLLKAPADSSAASRTPAAGVVEKARVGVVYVCVEVDGPSGAFVIERASSGVVVDPSGLVLTWRHLVQEAVGASDKTLYVQFDDAVNTRVPAAVETIDEATGLALLRVTPPAGGLTSVELGLDRPRAGEAATTIARPEGKEMLAFAGVASAALSAVDVAGKPFAPNDVFLTDSRSDLRCDGAPVVDGAGRLLGLYASTNVLRDKSDPTLEDLQKPSFGVVVTAGAIRRVFAKEFAGVAAKNASLQKSADAVASATADAVARVAPSVVSVWAGDGDWPSLGTTDPGAVQRRAGLGSGVVLSKSGLVATNAHLVKSGAARVKLLDGRTFPAKVVKTHSATNLALLQVELPAGASLSAADCNPDDDAILGETVLAVGNPIGTQVVVSGGVVSARRDREGGRIQADANLGNQNAGGAITDAVGRLLGIGDGGAVDALEVAFAQRGDKVTTETNLSTFVGIGRVRKVFQSQIEAAALADEAIRGPAPVSAADMAKRASPLVAMVQKTSGAMLNVYIARNVAEQKPDDPFPPDPQWVTLGLGSGVIIDRSGLAISNWHVVDEATNPDGSMRTDHQVTVRVFGGKQYPVRVLSISREDDLSLLQLELAPGEQVDAVELGSSDGLAIGESVAAIGNPHGRANTITFGVVSAKDQGIHINGRWAKMNNLIETDAAINGGNSGGALLDMNGRLVGINSAGGGTFTNKGYAIAVDHVRRQVLGLLFAAYKLRSPELGMRILDDDGRVVVMDVDDRGPAARAGVKSGDRVLALGDVPITWSPGFAMELLKKQPAVEVALEVERKGEKKTFQIAPVAPEVWAVIRQSGLLCRNLPYAENPDRVRAAATALHRQFTGDTTGEPSQIPENVVAVERVFPGEQPAEADVQAGDLLLAVELVRAGTQDPVLLRFADVAAVKDLWNDRLLGKYDEGQTWKCWIERSGQVRLVELRARRLFW